MKQQHSFDRHERVNSLLMTLAAEFILSEANTDPLITVTKVSTSSDYKNATIFFTTIPDGREEHALVFLKRTGGELRRYVKEHSKLKTLPFFNFEIDAGERHRQHLDEVVRKIDEGK